MADAGSGRVVVIAASAGGVEALRLLLPMLPADLPAPVLLTLHIPQTGGKALPQILSRAGRLPADTAADGEKLRPGRIYVAPPDHHLLITDGVVRVSRGPRHNGHRPAADPMFFSAALAAGPRVVAVVLSGTLDDGAAGCRAVERQGGLVLVQDPEESSYDGMPAAAIAATRHPRVLRLRELARVIDSEARAPVPGLRVAHDPGLARQLAPFLGQADEAGAPPEGWDGLMCPNCDGPLQREDGTSPVRFTCQAGHAWSAQSLWDAKARRGEQALQAALVSVAEQARLADVLARAEESQGNLAVAADARAAARASHSAARTIRRLLDASPPAAPDAGNGLS